MKYLFTSFMLANTYAIMGQAGYYEIILNHNVNKNNQIIQKASILL